MSIPKISISIAILCFFLNTTSAEERILYKKHWDFPPGSELFFNPMIYRLSDEYHNLTYVLCDNCDDPQKSECERNCTAVQDTQPERSCPVTLQSFNKNFQEYRRHQGDYLDIFPFGSTKAVIVWLDSRGPSFLKCTILDFITCESKDVLLTGCSSDFSQFTYFVAYDDSFELVVSSCTNAMHSKYHIDVEGNLISDLVFWRIPEYAVSAADVNNRAVVKDSKPEGYLHFAVGYYADRTRINQLLLIKPDGSNTVLADFQKNISISRNTMSTAHETIGVAVPVDDRADVLLFDYEGNLKLNTSVPHDIKVSFLALRNLADGEFLLLITGSKNITNKWRNPDTYYLKRVDADGKVVGTINMEPESNCEGKEPGHQVFENGPTEYCVATACGDESKMEVGEISFAKMKFAQLDLSVKCVSEEDFLIKSKNED